MIDINKYEEEEVCCDGTSICYNKLPPLSAKYPWFIVQNLEDLNHQFFSTLHNPGFKYQCRIPELSGKRIRGCFHGWLILSNHPHNNVWSLWNPSTTNIISLPPLILKDRDYNSIRECCLSAPPDDPTSVLLLMISNKCTFVFCKPSPKRIKCLRNKPRWTEMSYAYQLKRIAWNGRLLHSLTFCNGQIYALCTDGDLAILVIRVEIVVKDREVVIKLLLFGAGPFPPSGRCSKYVDFLTGTCKELFYITVGFRRETDKTVGDVFLFKLDMTSINWKELECLKKWDMTGVEELDDDRLDNSLKYLKITQRLWEQVRDLHDTSIFVVDLGRDNLEFYNPATASELGGYIHILDKMDRLIYSYHLNDETIVPSPMPSSVLPTSHMSMWKCWLEDDHREANRVIVDSKQVVPLIRDNVVEASESRLLDLPVDVLEMIMKLCVGVEYMSFRATCKHCRLAAPLIQWRNQTTLRNYSLVSPWLMVVDQARGIITFTDPVMGDNYFMRTCPQLSIDDDTICCSRFGWLLFKTTSDTCPVFFNPFTNDLRELPDPYYYLSTLWFSAPPTSSKCKVVGFSTKKILILDVAQDCTWEEFDLYTYPARGPICFPTPHCGDLYTLFKTGELRVVKDLGTADVSFKRIKAEIPRSCSDGSQKPRYFLVKCEQHLLLVVMVRVGEPIEVFKLIESSGEYIWEKIHGVGKHMIYICDTTCLCIKAKTPEMENKIYLAHLSCANKKIVFYSLETCMYYTFDGKSIQEKLGDVFTTTTYLSPHTWIEPSFSEEKHPGPPVNNVI